MKVIEKWLNGKRNFFVGAAIYKTIGSDANLFKLLDKGNTDIGQKELVRVLSSLLDKEPAKKVRTLSELETGKMPESDDIVLKSIREEWLIPYKKMIYLRHSLDQYEGNSPDAVERRKPIAFQILDLEQHCIKLWKKRDSYLETGHLPDQLEKPFVLPSDPIELGKLIETLKRNIRRNKQQMDKNPSKPLYPKLYKEYNEKYRLASGEDYKEAK